MQVINDAPVTHPQPVTVTALKLRDVVMRGIRVSGNLFDLRHNPLLQIHREPGKRFSEGLCGDDFVHGSIVTLSNIVGQEKFVTERNILSKGAQVVKERNNDSCADLHSLHNVCVGVRKVSSQNGGGFNVAKEKIPSNVKRILKMKIDPDDIIYLVRSMNEQRNEGLKPDFYSTIGILSDRCRGQHGKAFCIIERMQALAEIMKDERIRGWSFEGTEKGCPYAHEAVFIATAKCTLRGDGKRTWFDADEFFGIALAETESEGSA